MPFAQKYHGLAKQVFVRKCSKARIFPTAALEFVYSVTKSYDGEGQPGDEFIDCEILEMFDNDGWN